MNFQSVNFIKSIGFSDDLPLSEEREIAFCGRSNVGKSSLLNKLCNRKSLARVSSMPGKTTTVNFFTLGDGTILADLPGYGYAKRSDSEKKRWAELMERYFNSGRKIALVLQLLDIRHDPSADDMQMLDFLSHMDIPFMAVLTKKDKLTKNQLCDQLDYFNEILKPFCPVNILPFSATETESAEILRDTISSFLEDKNDAPS